MNVTTPIPSACLASATRRSQTGFTLIEAAIVLVIAALLTTAILSSQSVLKAARVNSLVAMVSELRTGIAGFQDRYGFMPGDCPNTVGDCIMWVTAPNGTTWGGSGNGDGTLNCCDAGSGVAAAGNESFNVPIHLFTTGFLAHIDAGNPNAFLSTPWGAVDITSSGSASQVIAFLSEPGNYLVRHTIVFSNVPCEIVQALDVKIDDGNLFRGRAMGVTPAGVLAGTCPDGVQMPFYAVAI